MSQQEGSNISSLTNSLNLKAQKSCSNNLCEEDLDAENDSDMSLELIEHTNHNNGNQLNNGNHDATAAGTQN